MFEKATFVSFAGDVAGFESGDSSHPEFAEAVCFVGAFPIEVFRGSPEKEDEDLEKWVAREVHCSASRTAAVARVVEKAGAGGRGEARSKAEELAQPALVVDPAVYFLNVGASDAGRGRRGVPQRSGESVLLGQGLEDWVR